ncbi:hypothetical protein DFH08DRAFT_878553 [Mycena albidolilacea]|uniref:Uncharacterized protein n=1 Tax=Mycena albidolilacea TaxID=1033008 RepID=A0AAD6ZRW9_9AGAR|nr:hypothetical protein DFH08DRAFT_878553 [Mycena albidolilacea]
MRPLSSKLGLRFATQLLMALAVSHFTTAAPHPGPTNNQLTARFVGDVEMCIDGLADSGCIILPLPDGECVDFTGGLTPWNDAVSNTIVPQGFLCTFYLDFGCGNDTPGDVVNFFPGTYDMFAVDFNDKASSIQCFAI